MSSGALKVVLVFQVLKTIHGYIDQGPYYGSWDALRPFKTTSIVSPYTYQARVRYKPAPYSLTTPLALHGFGHALYGGYGLHGGHKVIGLFDDYGPYGHHGGYGLHGGHKIIGLFGGYGPHGHHGGYGLHGGHKIIGLFGGYGPHGHHGGYGLHGGHEIIRLFGGYGPSGLHGGYGLHGGHKIIGLFDGYGPSGHHGGYGLHGGHEKIGLSDDYGPSGHHGGYGLHGGHNIIGLFDGYGPSGHHVGYGLHSGHEEIGLFGGYGLSGHHGGYGLHGGHEKFRLFGGYGPSGHHGGYGLHGGHEKIGLFGGYGLSGHHGGYGLHGGHEIFRLFGGYGPSGHHGGYGLHGGHEKIGLFGGYGLSGHHGGYGLHGGHEIFRLFGGYGPSGHHGGYGLHGGHEKIGLFGGYGLSGHHGGYGLHGGHEKISHFGLHGGHGLFGLQNWHDGYKTRRLYSGHKVHAHGPLAPHGSYSAVGQKDGYKPYSISEYGSYSPIKYKDKYVPHGNYIYGPLAPHGSYSAVGHKDGYKPYSISEYDSYSPIKYKDKYAPHGNYIYGPLAPHGSYSAVGHKDGYKPYSISEYDSYSPIKYKDKYAPHGNYIYGPLAPHGSYSAVGHKDGYKPYSISEYDSFSPIKYKDKYVPHGNYIYGPLAPHGSYSAVGHKDGYKPYSISEYGSYSPIKYKDNYVPHGSSGHAPLAPHGSYSAFGHKDGYKPYSISEYDSFSPIKYKDNYVPHGSSGHAPLAPNGSYSAVGHKDGYKPYSISEYDSYSPIKYKDKYAPHGNYIYGPLAPHGSYSTVGHKDDHKPHSISEYDSYSPIKYKDKYAPHGNYIYGPLVPHGSYSAVGHKDYHKPHSISEYDSYSPIKYKDNYVAHGSSGHALLAPHGSYGVRRNKRGFAPQGGVGWHSPYGGSGSHGPHTKLAPRGAVGPRDLPGFRLPDTHMAAGTYRQEDLGDPRSQGYPVPLHYGVPGDEFETRKQTELRAVDHEMDLEILQDEKPEDVEEAIPIVIDLKEMQEPGPTFAQKTKHLRVQKPKPIPLPIVPKDVKSFVVGHGKPAKVKHVVSGDNKITVFQESSSHAKEKSVVFEKLIPRTTFREKVRFVKPTVVPRKKKIILQNIKPLVVHQKKPVPKPAILPYKSTIVKPAIVGENKATVFEELKTHSKEEVVFHEARTPITFEKKPPIVVKEAILPVERVIVPVFKPPIVVKEAILPIKEVIVPVFKPPIVVKEAILPVERVIVPVFKPPIVVKEAILPIKEVIVPVFKPPIVVKEALPILLRHKEPGSKASIFHELKTYDKEQAVVHEIIKPAVVFQKKAVVLQPADGPARAKTVRKPAFVPHGQPLASNEARIFEELKTYSNHQFVVHDKVKPLSVGRPIILIPEKVRKPVTVDHKIPIGVKEVKPLIVPHAKTRFIKEVKPLISGERKVAISEELKYHTKENVFVKEKVKPVVYMKPVLLKSARPPVVKPAVLYHETPHRKPHFTPGDNKAAIHEELKTYSKEHVEVKEIAKPWTVVQKKPVVVKEPHKKPHGRIAEPAWLPQRNAHFVPEVKPFASGDNKVAIHEELKTYSKEHVEVKEIVKPLTVVQKKPVVVKEPHKKPDGRIAEPAWLPQRRPHFAQGVIPGGVAIHEELKTYSKENVEVREKVKPLTVVHKKPVIVAPYKKDLVLEEAKPVVLEKLSIFDKHPNPLLVPHREQNFYLRDKSTFTDGSKAFEPVGRKPGFSPFGGGFGFEEMKPDILDHKISIFDKHPYLPHHTSHYGGEVKPAILGKNKAIISEDLRNQHVKVKDTTKPVLAKVPVPLRQVTHADDKEFDFGDFKPDILDHKISIFDKHPLFAPHIRSFFSREVKPVAAGGSKTSVFQELKTYSKENVAVKEVSRPAIVKEATILPHKGALAIRKPHPVTLQHKLPVFVRPPIPIPHKPAYFIGKVKPVLVGENKATVFQELKTYSNEKLKVKEKLRPLEVKPAIVKKVKPIIIPHRKSYVLERTSPAILDRKFAISNKHPNDAIVPRFVGEAKPGGNKASLFHELKTYSNEKLHVKEIFKPVKVKPIISPHRKGLFIQEVKPVHKLPILETSSKPIYVSPPFILPQKKSLVLQDVKPVVLHHYPPAFGLFKPGHKISTYDKPHRPLKKRATIFEDLRTYSNHRVIFDEKLSAPEKKPIVGKTIEPLKKDVTMNRNFIASDRNTAFFGTGQPKFVGGHKAKIFEESRTYSNERFAVDHRVKPHVAKTPFIVKKVNPIPGAHGKYTSTVHEALKKPTLVGHFPPADRAGKRGAFVEDMGPLFGAKPIFVAHKNSVVPTAGQHKAQVFQELKTQSNEKAFVEEKLKPYPMKKQEDAFLDDFKPFFVDHRPPLYYEETKPNFYADRKAYPPPVVVGENKATIFQDLKTYSKRDAVVLEKMKPSIVHQTREEAILEQKIPFVTKPAAFNVKPRVFELHRKRPGVVVKHEPVFAGKFEKRVPVTLLQEELKPLVVKRGLGLEDVKQHRKSVVVDDVKGYDTGDAFYDNAMPYGTGSDPYYDQGDYGDPKPHHAVDDSKPQKLLEVRSYKKRHALEQAEAGDASPDFYDKKFGPDKIKDYVYGVKDYGEYSKKDGDAGYSDRKEYDVVRSQGIGHGGAGARGYAFGQKKDYSYGVEKDFGFGKSLKYGKEKSYSFGKKSKRGFDTEKLLKSYVFGDSYKKDLSFKFDEKKGESISDKIDYAAGKAFDIEKGIEKAFKIKL